MPRPLVLVNKPIHAAALQRLQQEAEVLTPYEATADEVCALLPQAEAIVLGGGLHLDCLQMDVAGKLEVIGRNGVGLDNVDVVAATERGIPVTFTPYGPTESTAEHALMLILATARRLSQMDRAVRSGNFDIRDQAEAMGHEMEGKALGVVGLGRIGRRVVEMASLALHMAVYAFDPHLDAATVGRLGAVRVDSLVEMAAMVDVLSIHTPLLPETRHLIDRDVLRAARPGMILVNTSRGPVVDEAALIEALQDGRLAGAGLDVFDPQPPAAGNPLLRFEQVVLTPHVASFTHEGRLRMGWTVVEDVLRALRGEKPEYLANPAVWSRRRGQGSR